MLSISGVYAMHCIYAPDMAGIFLQWVGLHILHIFMFVPLGWLVGATRRGSIKLAARETLNRVMHLQKVATSKTCTCMIFTLFDLQPMRLLQQEISN